MRRAEFFRTNARDASKLKVGIALSRFNSDITDAMLEGARTLLNEWMVADKNVSLFKVSGSFELPYAAATLARKKKPHAIIALGCIIKGETEHDRHIATAVANGLTSVSTQYSVPVAFGVLTVNSLEQARARATGETNHGYSAAAAALSAALDSAAL